MPAACTPSFILSALPLLLSAIILAGCYRGDSPRGRPLRGQRLAIELWSGWTGGEGKVFQALVDRFNRTRLLAAGIGTGRCGQPRTGTPIVACVERSCAP